MSTALRETRWLGSQERRVAGDLLLGLVRHERALARIDPDPLSAWVALAEGGPPDLDDPPDAYAIATSLPDWLATEWWARLGADAATSLAQTLAERAPTSLRVLRPPVAIPVAHERVGERGIVLRAGANLDTWPDYRAGRLIVQDLGSQAIVDRIFPGEGARVLDLCAGAGGKSLALAAMGCRVQAWDKRTDALRELVRRAARSGLEVEVGPPRGRYDLVLVDAPCSGTGVLRRHPEHRWRLEFPREEQREVLLQGRSWGDNVVYATCALTLRENEELVRSVGAVAWEETLWPRPGAGDGFYVARLAA